MSPLDIAVIIILIVFAYLGYVTGAIIQIMAFAGLFIGLAIGSRLDLWFLHTHPTVSTPIRVISIILAVVLGTGLFLLGEKYGSHIRVRIHRTKLYMPDKYAGIVAGLLVGVLLVCFGSSFILNNSSVNAQNTVLESKVIGYVSRSSVLGVDLSKAFYVIDPDQVIKVIGDRSTLVSQVGSGVAQYNLPTQGPFVAAIDKDYKSVVLIEWEGCGGLHFGSGYVISNQDVVTAAHVVAGSGLVKISDTTHSYVGTVILYDTKKDLAVIRVPGLPDAPLEISTNVQPISSQTTLLGYKEAGPLTDGIGPIISYGRFSSVGVQISGEVKISGNTLFYGVEAPSNHGDSGGPLITTDGSVIGHLSFVAFQDANGQPVTGGADGDFSYFVSVNNYASEVHSIEKSKTRVSTGSCLSFNT